ncbi:hypothetical protein O6P43_025372 [Quillaja saponaria]|uniref:Uncharacterized protein n=1 Tax=Quillaja saponaria TaxID=32244 RepID=A0AAD7L919_QUISA|nr:hypothetical protein O6P43_025372 [Quillaja saponaria]
MANKACKHKKKPKSLCEQSILLVANIIKLSSFTLGGMTLGTNIRRPGMTSGRDNSSRLVPKVGRSRSQRSQEPESIRKPRSYLMKPAKNVPPVFNMQQIDDVNATASDYIKRIREKIGNDHKDTNSI